MTPSPSGPAGLSKSLLLLMALATGMAAGNLYYNQPLLGEIQRSLQASASALAAVPAATQLGYAAGLLLLGPLGDRYERRSVILGLGALLVVALVAAGLAPGIHALAAASLAIGLCATLAQQIVPMAAAMSSEAQRGRTIGAVMSGLLLGVLLARAVAGLLGQALGWRAVFFCAALAMALLLVLLHRRLPTLGVASPLPYRALIGSVFAMPRRYPALRQACLTGGLTFAALSCFWVSLAPLLESPAFGLDARAAGLFGLIGLAGVLAAPLFGRLADRTGSDRLVFTGCVMVALAYAFFGAGGASLALLAAGTVVVDLGVQATMIGNQSLIFGLDPAARSRVNAAYMTSYFLGGALGSLASSHAWAAAGWRGVCLAGAAFAVAATLVQWRGLRRAAPRA